MAAVIVFRNHLINNLQLPAAVVSQIINIHGYDSVNEFASATDREIRDLISTIRKTPSVAIDAASPKIVLGQTYAIRILHFMYYTRLITEVGRQHTIGPAEQATSTINNTRTNENMNGGGTDRFSKEGNIILNDGTYSNHIWWNVLNEDERKFCESLRQRKRNRKRNTRNERNVSNVETRKTDEERKQPRMLGTE